MRRILLAFAIGAAVMTPSIASAQQALNFSIGGFVPRGEDGRSSTDVLVGNRDFLAFDIKDFNGTTFGAEWLTGLGNNFEAGLGAGYYARTVPTVYLDFVNDNGTEIEQDIKLRVVPFSATVRFLLSLIDSPFAPTLYTVTNPSGLSLTVASSDASTVLTSL